MPIVPVTIAQPVNPGGGFDYITIDAERGRIYAAHAGARGLLVADADTGNTLGLVPVGPMAGVAYDKTTGLVYTGNGDSRSVSEVDPDAMKILRTVPVDGPVDAIAYDPVLGRIYADEDDGTRIFVIDTKTFTQIATIHLPGHKPEYIQVDPQTHEIYQNIATNSEIAVIDPKTFKVTRLIKTPEITNNHPLQLDAAHHDLLVAGENGVLSVYNTAGTLQYKVAYPGRVDQCDFDATRGWLACAGGGITLFSFDGVSAPKLLDHVDVAPGVHNVAIDGNTGTIWVDWYDRTTGSANIQGFTYKP